MNKSRAKQIIESPDMVKVTYQGEPVYIQHVNEEKETARVYPLSNTENEQEVPLHSLIEE